MQIDRFGTNKFTWNTEEPAENDGLLPGIALFRNAIQVWSLAQDDETTIERAAAVFNVKPDLVRQAVNAHDWMYVAAGDLIEHERE
jgi:hypothetical protein